MDRKSKGLSYNGHLYGTFVIWHFHSMFVNKIISKTYMASKTFVSLFAHFFSVGMMKLTVYWNSPHICDDFEMTITYYIQHVDLATLNTVFKDRGQ